MRNDDDIEALEKQLAAFAPKANEPEPPLTASAYAIKEGMRRVAECKHGVLYGPAVSVRNRQLVFQWSCMGCGQEQIIAESCPMTPEAVTPRASLNLELDDAVRILNEKKHRGITDWAIEGNSPIAGEPDAIACSKRNPLMAYLTEFESLATAERYLREKSE